jgi:hypothetical protein
MKNDIESGDNYDFTLNPMTEEKIIKYEEVYGKNTAISPINQLLLIGNICYDFLSKKIDEMVEQCNTFIEEITKVDDSNNDTSENSEK